MAIFSNVDSRNRHMQLGQVVSDRSVTAQNQFSDGEVMRGNFNISISGTWSATIWVQRSFDNSTWLDVISYTANVETYRFEPEANVYYRIGCKTGGYTSGTAVVRLSQ